MTKHFQIFKLKTTNSSSTSFLQQDDFIRDQLLKCTLIEWLDYDSSNLCFVHSRDYLEAHTFSM